MMITRYISEEITRHIYPDWVNHYTQSGWILHIHKSHQSQVEVCEYIDFEDRVNSSELPQVPTTAIHRPHIILWLEVYNTLHTAFDLQWHSCGDTQLMSSNVFFFAKLKYNSRILWLYSEPPQLVVDWCFSLSWLLWNLNSSKQLNNGQH